MVEGWLFTPRLSGIRAAGGAALDRGARLATALHAEALRSSVLKVKQLVSGSPAES